MPPPRIVISSESEKSFSFAVKKGCEKRDHRKHRTLCGVGSRCFMQTALRRKTETANEKDPSTALGMTIRERAVSHSLSSRSGSEPPPLRGTSFRGEGGSMPPSPHALFPHLNTRTGWRPVRAVFLESSEWSSHKTIGL